MLIAAAHFQGWLLIPPRASAMTDCISAVAGLVVDSTAQGNECRSRVVERSGRVVDSISAVAGLFIDSTPLTGKREQRQGC